MHSSEKPARNCFLLPLVYICECTLYFSSPQQFFFSPLLRTDSRRNKYQFYILFLRVFPSYFNIFLTGHLLLLVRSFLIRAGFDLYHHSDLDLCNFYGPSVRISARYKTPNPLCSSSLLLPFFIFSRSLCFFSPQKKYHSRDSLIHSSLHSIFRRLPNQTLITGFRPNLDLFPISLFLPRYTQFH